MKVKLIQSNNLQNLERELNKFIDDIKVKNIDLKIQDKNYIVIISYYDKI